MSVTQSEGDAVLMWRTTEVFFLWWKSLVSLDINFGKGKKPNFVSVFVICEGFMPLEKSLLRSCIEY